MEMTIIDKLSLIVKYLFSSFMGIELLILSFLLFCFLIINIFKDNKTVKCAFIAIFSIFFIVIAVCYKDYSIASIDSLIKGILHYIYFPSMASYFIIMILITISLIVTILNKKIPKGIRVLNYFIYTLEYLFFISVISICITNNINLTINELIYQNNTILAFVQVGNIILFFYIEIILLYLLLKYFKKKFD